MIKKIQNIAVRCGVRTHAYRNRIAPEATALDRSAKRTCRLCPSYVLWTLGCCTLVATPGPVGAGSQAAAGGVSWTTRQGLRVLQVLHLIAFYGQRSAN